MKRKLAGSMWQVKPISRSQGSFFSGTNCPVVPQPIEPYRLENPHAVFLEGDTVLVTGEPVPTIDPDPLKKHHRFVPVMGRDRYGDTHIGYMNETYFVYGSIWMEKLA
jgi:hypothetical protein